MQKMLIEPKSVIFPKSQITGKSVGRKYCVGKIQSLDGKYHQVALTQTIGPGNTSAAMRANSLLEHFPKLDVITFARKDRKVEDGGRNETPGKGYAEVSA